MSDKNYAKIINHAAELVPTVQFGNVTIGPIGIIRYVEDTDLDNLKKEINKSQTLCEEIVSEDRNSVQKLIRQSTDGRYVE